MLFLRLFFVFSEEVSNAQFCNSYLFLCTITFTLIYPYVAKKVLFFGQRFWWIYKSRGPLNQKITFLVVGLFVCESVISITQKQTIAETSYLILYIFIIWRSYLKLFMKIGQIICVQRHKNKQINKYITAHNVKFLDSYFSLFKLQ